MDFIEIRKRVKDHHRLVSERYPFVLMTSLFGSQNYKLDTDNSDIDTCSFILPSKKELMNAEPITSTEFECEDGKCVVKDFRQGLNLLLKTSPNSLEWFASRWKVFNPDFDECWDWVLGNKLDDMLYANHSNMLASCCGLSKQLGTRNMPSGKRIAHLLRIRDLWESYSLHDRVGFYNIEFRYDKTREEALYTKTHDVTKEYELQIINEIESYFQKQKAEFDPNDPDILDYEKRAKRVIEKFRERVVSTWIKLISDNESNTQS